ncbi:HD-domain/PDEase-like protein [Pseudovirgaria hyperparasitica]|uniref:Phosphodiesterase n=1 Tax=Pseudovirgaria hyperparasitica TaxID=470096 RepID=A0A6A6W3G3_9PEZI|nr:HD-domain/PDEase-like protein [Pseudovirgaria hyperparasitica]KAF2756470.1 HD-domain/PDEase-like protein [Pseudovirgaria hyperparasitica]
MDHGACNVIYLDKRAVDEHVRRNTLSESWAVRNNSTPGPGNDSPGYFHSVRPKNPTEVLSNIEHILSVFNEVHVCNTGASCLTRLSDLNENLADLVPTILLIDIPLNEERRLKRLSREPRTPSPNSMRRPLPDNCEPDDLYGMHLLQHVASEIQQRSLSRMVLPIAMLSGVEETERPGAPARTSSASQLLNEGTRSLRYVDAGAVDVYTSPLTKGQVHSLAVHAYRTRKEASKEDTNFLAARRNRKVSWVGVDDTKPYAYLREVMVSGLMGGICNPDTIGDNIDPNDIEVQPERIGVIAKMIGTWEFSAHDFTDDELLYGALLILKHALGMPELEQWRMDTDELTILLLASRTAYNEFVLYHNFRHVVDVLQALFFFLVQIGTLPPYPAGSSSQRKSPPSALAALLKPFDALTLLVSAVGHDVGHPGVNNAFLVALNSPLAQLYNDRSVLESFHCAAYSQILRRYWPGAFSDTGMRKLMINSILATDMGLHFKYMGDLGNLQSQLAHNNNTLDGWSPKVLEEYKELLCGLLIKCADISNVARKFDTAANWARILTDEFSNQGDMEQELEMPTCLFGGPPVLDSVIKMGESQIGFMNIFARPLFEAVSDVVPAMRFSLDEILTNKSIWERKIELERENQTKLAATGMLIPRPSYDTAPSPFSGS